MDGIIPFKIITMEDILMQVLWVVQVLLDSFTEIHGPILHLSIHRIIQQVSISMGYAFKRGVKIISITIGRRILFTYFPMDPHKTDRPMHFMDI